MPGWAPVCVASLTEDIPGYIEPPANALTYAWTYFIGGHPGAARRCILMPAGRPTAWR